MNANNHKTRWWLDALLLAAFFVSFILDLTGVGLHQWLGAAVGLLAAYHLLSHWTWVRSVSQRLGRTSGQARAYYLVDAGLLLGFTGILASGLVISTWLDLPLNGLSGWRDLHVGISIATLTLVCVKVSLHWRWIVNIARRYVFPPAERQATANQPPGSRSPRQPLAQPVGDGQRTLQPRPGRVASERRDFLKLAGVMSAAAFISLASAMDLGEGSSASGSGLAAGTGDSAANSRASDSAQSSLGTGDTSGGSSGSCTRQCRRGCSYPGHCRRYTDANRNNLCDLGECL